MDSGAYAYVNITTRGAEKTPKTDEGKLYHLMAREVAMIRRFNHPNIVKVLDFIHTDEEKTIILEPLNKIIPPVSLEKSKRYMNHLLHGVAEMHKQKIAHLDIKLGNIMTDDHDVLKLIDFGLSALFSDKPQSGIVGTQEYMAPEIKDQWYADKLDIWACGVCYYMMRYEQAPYNAQKLESYKNLKFDTVPNRPLDAIMADCFIKTPDQRPSAEDLIKKYFQ